MKKVMIFTFLLFASLSCAFCVTLSEVHSVRLRTSIEKTTPAFQLVFISGMADSSNSVVVNSGAVQFEDGRDFNEYGTAASAIDVADISRNNLVLMFTARLANNAKCNTRYTLRVTAGSFDVTRGGVPGVLRPDEDPVLETDSGIAELLGVSVENISGTSMTIRFNGTECRTGNLAGFTVKYTADSSIDDTSDNEYYYADISMEITSES